MNEYVKIGMCAGIFFGLLLAIFILKVTKKDGRIKCEYDERQNIVRGTGYKIAFFTLLTYNVAYGVLASFEEKTFIDPFAAMILGICLSIAIHVVYCIWNEAYFSLNESPKKLLIAFALIAIFNLFAGGVGIIEGEAVIDGMLTYRITNIIFGILFIIIFVTLLAKKMKNKDIVQ